MINKVMRQIAFAFLIVFALGTSAQTTKEEVLSDLNRTGGVYYAYPVSESMNTPAPKGYKPFYISHYGRHGSRYLISDNDYIRVSDLLHKAKDSGAVTPLGEDVMHRVDSLLIETRKRGGDLTPLGVRQHRGIAERMAVAYPEVFAGKDKKISARSTLVVRCVLSMAAFCERLKEINPELHIDRESSERYMGYLCHHSPESNAWRDDKSNFKEEYRKFEEKHTNPDRITASLFSNPAFVAKNVNPHELMWSLYWIASDKQDAETKIDFYDLFTPDELFDLWQCENYRFYAGDGNYPGSNGLIINNAIPLVKNIIESADDAIAGKGDAATLRFGHDGNLIPLAALLHLKDCDLQEENPEEFYKAFADWKIAPMAGNVQLVFFRDPKHPEKPVLVKFMLNEREVSIPVDTDNYPFYDWDAVKAFYAPIISVE